MVDAAAGPLIVSEANPRYFTVGSIDRADRRAVYLTGSHIWNSLHDGLGPGPKCADTPERSDYGAYLEFLKDHGHNFIRLWRWEQFTSQAVGGKFHLCMTPQPWPRTGPGTAKDGKPKFDLSAFDQAFFDRLRHRVVAAGNEGVYVAVMLFDGFGLHLSPAPDNVEGHPFHAASNVNDIGITSIVDCQMLPLDPRIQSLQEAYIRKVVDSVHDLPNVLYEVANASSGVAAESIRRPNGSSIPMPVADSTQWQYWVIACIKQYEQAMGYDKHPVGMRMRFPAEDQRKVNEPLFNSPADWVSPGFDDVASPAVGLDASGGRASRWYTNPPPNDGTKVVIVDTDHYAPGKGDALWAWKSFIRGHNPILMDFGIIGVVNPLDPSMGVPPSDSFEPARYAMGDTLRYAKRMDLIHMVPRGDLTSTTYALANPGREYVVLQPWESGEPFTIELVAGRYAVEWHGVHTRETVAADPLTVEWDGAIQFRPPFAARGSSVVYLKRVGAHRWIPH